MTDVTQILNAIEQGDPSAAEQLMPLVYNELRKLAAAKLAHEKPGQTLQATALVHEAYLRLVTAHRQTSSWESRRHFFAAAAEAMRRILVERARRKAALKHGGRVGKVDLKDGMAIEEDRPDELLALDSALDELQLHHRQAAELVKLRFFSGLTHQEAAQSMGISRRAADRLWVLARAWLYRRIGEQ